MSVEDILKEHPVPTWPLEVKEVADRIQNSLSKFASDARPIGRVREDFDLRNLRATNEYGTRITEAVLQYAQKEHQDGNTKGAEGNMTE